MNSHLSYTIARKKRVPPAPPRKNWPEAAPKETSNYPVGTSWRGQSAYQDLPGTTGPRAWSRVATDGKPLRLETGRLARLARFGKAGEHAMTEAWKRNK